MKKIIALLLLVFITAGCSSNEHDHSAGGEAKKTYYCPMHPEVTSDKPSVCPICQMDLVIKGDENAVMESDLIKLSDGKQILANVKTYKAAKENVTKSIKSFGIIDFAEPNKKSITARFSGRIEKLFVNKTGDFVNTGTPLFEIYSPDLVQAQNEFLIARSSGGSKSLASQSEKKLILLGFTNEQIRDLASTGEVKTLFTYHSPFNGTVIEKKIQEGSYVNEGSALYEIADLSVVWNISEVYAEDLSYIKKGSRVKITSPAFPTQKFDGTVDFVYPVADQQNRTVKVRSVIINSGMKLRPNLYTETSFNTGLGSFLTIPAEAIIMTGRRNIVWVKISANEFKLREVTLGAKTEGKYQILSGLEEGEEVAMTGGYLIDSENQLKGGVDHSSHNMTGAGTALTAGEKQIWNKICPVMGNPVDPKAPSIEYKGKLIGFCCAGCDDQFKADPEKYIKNLNSDGTKFITKK